MHHIAKTVTYIWEAEITNSFMESWKALVRADGSNCCSFASSTCWPWDGHLFLGEAQDLKFYVTFLDSKYWLVVSHPSFPYFLFISHLFVSLSPSFFSFILCLPLSLCSSFLSSFFLSFFFIVYYMSQYFPSQTQKSVAQKVIIERIHWWVIKKIR